MWPADQYQLVDYGHSRKLERFGSVVLDRPCPAAANDRPHNPGLWSEAHAQLHTHMKAVPQWLKDGWLLQSHGFCLQLRITPFGHVGLFPEHLKQWQWLVEQGKQDGSNRKSLLNLFAYTGAGTLYLATHGWQVTHVDSSAPTIAWARHNAELSGLKSAPIRWLVEDARSYAQRELRRGQKYDAVMLDPPTYGHGPKGRAWEIERDLPELLDMCQQLLKPEGLLVLTGHSQENVIESQQSDLDMAIKRFADRANGLVRRDSGRMLLEDSLQRPLDFGWYQRVWVEASASSIENA